MCRREDGSVVIKQPTSCRELTLETATPGPFSLPQFQKLHTLDPRCIVVLPKNATSLLVGVGRARASCAVGADLTFRPTRGAANRLRFCMIASPLCNYSSPLHSSPLGFPLRLIAPLCIRAFRRRQLMVFQALS